VLWLRRRAIVRAFEVEHTTAVYSGLLRMADLLALQPNMNIRLHIVAPDDRREKVFREMLRPEFFLLERGPLARSCTFMSYESVEAIRTPRTPLSYARRSNLGLRGARRRRGTMTYVLAYPALPHAFPEKMKGMKGIPITAARARMGRY
jgi:hypothetical protein